MHVVFRTNYEGEVFEFRCNNFGEIDQFCEEEIADVVSITESWLSVPITTGSQFRELREKLASRN